MERELAAKIYLLSKENKDSILLLLEVLKLAEDSDIAKIIEIYKNIKSGKISIVQTATSVELSQDQKQEVADSIKQQFKNKDLIFVFEIKKNIKHGISINIGDDKIQFSFNK